MSNSLEINSSRIKFEDLLSLVDKAINSGAGILIRKSMMSQNNTTMKFLKWLEKHRIISLLPTEIRPPKSISIRSRTRKVEVTLQFRALELPMKEIASKFSVKLATAQGYLKELVPVTDQYLQALKLILKLKNITLNTKLEDFPSFPIRIYIKDLEVLLTPSDYDKLMKVAEQDRYIRKVTSQKLGTSDLSILLPK